MTDYRPSLAKLSVLVVIGVGMLGVPAVRGRDVHGSHVGEEICLPRSDGCAAWDSNPEPAD